MGLDKVLAAPRKRDVSSKVIADRKMKNTPSLRLMTQKEIENNRVNSYEFAI